MAIDEIIIRNFIDISETRKQLTQVFERAGFQVVHTVEYAHQIWGVHLKPNKPLREILDISREVLLWVTEFPDFQAKTVRQAAYIIQQCSPRLADSIALIVSADDDTRQRVEEMTEKQHTHYLGFSIKELLECLPLGKNEFIPLLQTRFYTKDLYYVSTAITSTAAFFGRRGALSEMVGALRQGTSHIALFGLRKMGKTSVLFRLLDLIRGSTDVFYAHLDIQRLDSINPSTEYFLWSVGEQLRDSNKAIRSIRSFRLFGQHTSFGTIVQKDTIPEDFDYDIRQILNSTSQRIIILIDEVELMSPETPGSNWGNAFVRCWRLLRGLDQQYQGRFSFFITGTNPRCIESNKLDGIENPAYNYFTKRFLSPLLPDESNEMLDRLGLRMGLLWSSECLAHVYTLVGGHPFLLRAFGSHIHKHYQPRKGIVGVDIFTIRETVPTFLNEMNSTFSQMIEVLQDHYGDEFTILDTLASGRMGEFRELAEAFPSDVAHLAGYGIIKHTPTHSSFISELLHTWFQLRRRERSDTNSDHNESQTLQRNDVFEGYRIQEVIGHTGGFAKVYKVDKSNNPKKYVALKILNSGSLAALQREVDVLASVNHPGIVKIFNHGKSAKGQLYIAMEFLEGTSLRHFCRRGTRLILEEAIRITTDLLEALRHLHPDDSKLKQLRQKQELTIEELGQLNKARHGYIHRDIKPENIIVRINTREPVLIDFGISVRVADPVKTVSATPGYLPPDGIYNQWSPDIDLFQLGLTMLQASTGMQFDGSNKLDLQAASQFEHPQKFAAFLSKLCANNKEERYTTAAEALTDIAKLRG